jgi:hypothetical protein
VSARGGTPKVNFDDPEVRHYLTISEDGRRALALIERSRAAERPRMRAHLRRAAERAAIPVLDRNGVRR